MFFHFHPFEVFVDHNTTRIIMGTLPPPRFCLPEFKPKDVHFCYGSQDNLLWPILQRVYKQNFDYEPTKEAITQRKDFLTQQQLGVCDIVESCKREKIDASDLGMSEIKLRPILEILSSYPKIHTILFMGGSSKNGPEYFLKQLLKEEGIKYEKLSNEVPKKHQFRLKDRVIKTVALTSPSNAANRYIGSNELYKRRKSEESSYTTLDFRVEQYEKVFKA